MDENQAVKWAWIVLFWKKKTIAMEGKYKKY